MNDNSTNLDGLTKSFEEISQKINALFAETFRTVDFSTLLESINKSLKGISESCEKLVLPNIICSLKPLRKSLEELSNNIKIDFNPLIDTTLEVLKSYDFQEEISRLEKFLPKELEIKFTDDEIQLVNELDNSLDISHKAKLDKSLIINILMLLFAILTFIQSCIASSQSSKQMERIIENQDKQLEETKRLVSYENRVTKLLESISSQLEQSSQESS